MSHPLQADLEHALSALDLDVSDEKVKKLLAYLDLLQKWNKVYNLTAIRDPKEMLVKHLFDSLAVVPLVSSESLIDVGTGGGLPGIPLAILYPERQIDLLDSNSKKTRFLIQAKAELGLKNTQVLHQRVETYQPTEKYAGVISRAFASLDDMLHWTSHLVKPNGYWWAMKSQKTQQELESLPEGITLKQIYDLDVPQLGAERTLIQLINERT